MKIKRNILRLIFTVALFAFGVYTIQAADVSSIQWNATAQSQILNNTELAKLGDVFPGWKIKQVVWPADSEINLKKVAVDPKLTASCMEWLMKFIKTDQLPVGLDQKLIPMKGWGTISKESEQKRLCDVFIARYKKGDNVIQIQESPYNIIIAVADERLEKNPHADHRNLIIETARSFLSGPLQPNLNSTFFHVGKIDKEGKIARISWSLERVIVIDKDGKKCMSLSEAGKIGTSGVEAETDGRFVRFEIIKSPGAVKNAYFDPYIERFSSSGR